MPLLNCRAWVPQYLWWVRIKDMAFWIVIWKDIQEKDMVLFSAGGGVSGALSDHISLWMIVSCLYSCKTGLESKLCTWFNVIFRWNIYFADNHVLTQWINSVFVHFARLAGQGNGGVKRECYYKGKMFFLPVFKRFGRPVNKYVDFMRSLTVISKMVSWLSI